MGHIKAHYPRDKGTLRPFRLWNAKDRKPLQWRYFAFHDNAIDAAMRDVKWLKGRFSALEVYNTTNGTHIATISVNRRGSIEHLDIWVNPNWNFKRAKDQ